MTVKKAAEIAAGVAALAGALGCCYYLYGPKGAKHRHQVKGWALKMKGEILNELENLKELNEKKYHEVVEKAAKHYEAVKKVNKKELAAVTKELKSHWKHYKARARR